MLTPSEAEFEGLAREDFDIIPVCREIPGDLETPVGAFLKIGRGLRVPARKRARRREMGALHLPRRGTCLCAPRARPPSGADSPWGRRRGPLRGRSLRGAAPGGQAPPCPPTRRFALILWRCGRAAGLRYRQVLRALAQLSARRSRRPRPLYDVHRHRSGVRQRAPDDQDHRQCAGSPIQHGARRVPLRSRENRGDYRAVGGTDRAALP